MQSIATGLSTVFVVSFLSACTCRRRYGCDTGHWKQFSLLLAQWLIVAAVQCLLLIAIYRPHPRVNRRWCLTPWKTVSSPRTSCLFLYVSVCYCRWRHAGWVPSRCQLQLGKCVTSYNTASAYHTVIIRKVRRPSGLHYKNGSRYVIWNVKNPTIC